MEYIRIIWKHASLEDPSVIYSELETLNGLRYESRKVETWKDGRIGYANQQHHTLTTQLGDQPFSTIVNQSLEDLLKDSISNDVFEPTVISKEEFEEVYRQAINSGK